jgi:hypothetical protein
MSSREARAHAAIVAVVLWALAAVLLLRPGPRDLFGTLKGADFVHFYTLGHLALRRDAPTLYDAAAQYVEQVRLVPASVGDQFVPIYPPQTALLFAPFALLSYPWGACLWAALTAAVYAFAVRAASARWRQGRADRLLVIAAAAAFPPFWNLILHGQTTVVPLAAFALGGAALARQRPFLAGLALGLIAIKPQFGLVLAVLAVACGEWRLIAGGAVSVALQAAAAAIVFGAEAWFAYGGVLRRLSDLAPLLEPRPISCIRSTR